MESPKLYDMFKDIDENQKKFREFLETEEGKTVVKEFLEGDVPDFSKMFEGC